MYMYIPVYIIFPPLGLNPRRQARVRDSLPQIRRQRELPRTSEVCPYIVKYLILWTSQVFVS